MNLPLKWTLIWGNDLRSTRHPSIPLHILWIFCHGQDLPRFLKRARQKAGQGLGSGMQKRKISKFIGCHYISLAKAEKEITTAFVLSFKLTEFLITLLCHKILSEQQREVRRLHFSLQGIFSKTPGFAEVSQFGVVMMTQILLGVSCFVLSFYFCLAPKNKQTNKMDGG